MASETDQSFKDLSWFLQAIKDPQLQNRFNLQTLSFSSSSSVKTTHCQLLTSTSMNINVTRDNLASSLSQIFIELATSLETQTSLRNLEFEGITWDDDIEILQSLGLLLDNASTIKHLAFRKNRFTEHCLNELSEILRRNSSLKEVTFSESRIGSRGATLLASALQVNDSLEELQIWEDSIGSKGAEELSKMIETNSSLKLFSIFDSNPFTATPLISAVLALNRETEVHVWSGGERTSKVVEFLPESNALRIYQIDASGSCRVATALGMNTTVRSLDMTGATLDSRWAKEFRLVLEQNRTLREVKLSETGLKDKAVVYVAAGLFKNKSLQSLYVDGNRFGSIGVSDLLCPLSRFTALQLQANITLKSVVFGGPKTKVGRDGLTAILKMLTTNETVVHLGIHDDTSLGPDDFVHIFKSLQKNASLRRFSLQGCKGVRGDRVLEAITETLQVNPLIEEIDLARTPLQDSGKADEIYQKLGHNGRKIDEEVETDSFRDMPLTEPKSVRAFLCGQDYAGKTTLCNSIMQNFSASGFSYVENVRTLMSPVEQAVKTGGGMKIKTFVDEGTKISMWNLAGQHEFYALHDLMFPSPCLFLIILSLFKKPSNKEPKTAAEVEGELQYWLRFIVSNSRKAVQQCMKPNVTIVLTHSEKVNQQSDSFQGTLVSIERQRDKFQDSVDFFPTVFTVDARSSPSVSRLTHHIRVASKGILQRVPRVYQLCNDMVRLLSDWRSENANRPVMRWKAFGDLCQYKVPSLRIKSRNENTETVETRRRAIATCLHQTGEVIYFEECGFLILDYEWFCGEVLAQLIKLDVRKQSTGDRNGFVSKKEMEKILKSSLQSPIPGMTSKVLEHLDVCDLVRLMKKLELCYEEDPSSPDSSLLVPSILENGRGKTQKWQINTQDCVYSGRHLHCDDSSHMFLTPGFFPRLQVHLHNRIMELKNQHGATYSLEKYLIDITIQGINIRVELGGQLGDYIDVLACSTKSLTETLRLINQLIIPAILNSCHGVILLEHIIRPQCVQDFTPPRFRQSQFVSLQRLKEALSSVPAEVMYDYQHTWESVVDSGKTILRAGFDLARDLLSDDDFREVLQRRYHDLHTLAQELQVPTEDDPEAVPVTNELENVDPSFGGIAKGVEAVLRRLKIIEQEIRDLKQEIQGLRYYEHRLLIQLHHKVNYLVNYNVQMDERKVPNMFYFITPENYGRRLITSIVPGMVSLRIHMLCEFRREMHVVEDQLGCDVMQIDNRAVKCLAPYMTGFMTLVTFALRIGANWAAGMGHMIPDLGHAIAHLATPSVMAGAAGAAGAVGVAAALGRNRGRDRDIQEQEQRAAQQWLIDYLREQNCSTGKDIAEKFGLWRVRYRDDGSIAWICKRHLITRANEVIQVPL
ncbi:Protein TORNADO 1 [Raphanus sativus]|uniref:Protein TORNADO 1 n=1 Tax=Raphanus sativus TaxID=3726 RepID=A0A6J0LXD6_RAPSA|nr:protein TORNADO 1 [Raphanus sativus]KAJ4875481.1 Protein TORNADO 1 [Raphanus sativus]